jgi:hypothetical protein
MRKNLIIALAVIAGTVFSFTSCILGEDIDTLEKEALKTNLGLSTVSAEIQGVSALADKTPVENIETDQYKGAVKWSPDDETFKLNVKYTATITLTPKSGYTLNMVKANYFTVAGAELSSNAKKSGVITAEFPTAKKGISISAIEGITVPVLGGSPKTEITDNDQYTGTVTWSPAVTGTFARDVKYTATITLTPKPDYTFLGIEADFFTVAGAESVTNKENSGVITAVFPTTTLPKLTEGVWTESVWNNASVSAGGYGGSEQWFQFTATSYQQYIHVNFGTMNNASNGLMVYIYNSNNSTNFIYSARVYKNGTYNSQTYIQFFVTSGQTYYIKVTPATPGYLYNGTYQITFNKSDSPPPPSNATALTAGVWEDGNLSTTTNEQWFKFTATASTQYIHVNFGTLEPSNGVYVQLYNSNGNTNWSEARFSNGSKYKSFYLINGQTYYLKVTPVNSATGTYQITFNTSSTPPLPKNSATATALTANVWADGNFTTSTGEQWFKFTATSSNTYYIHAGFGTLGSSYGVYVQVYDSTGNTIGYRTSLSVNQYTSSYTSLSVTNGQTYYIEVSNNYYTGGTYKIGFNTTFVPPGTTELTAGTWADGNIATSNSEQWFKFTSTSSPQYIHVSLGSSSNVYFKLYSSDGSYISERYFTSSTYDAINLSSGQTYYIKASYSNSTGTFKIAFSTSTTPPSP